MTTAAVRSATDPRRRRGPVGRRALQVVLFLGGLLALGLLFGTRAHAAQQPALSLPGTGATITRAADTETETEAEVATGPARTAVEPSGRQAADTVAGTKTGRPVDAARTASPGKTTYPPAQPAARRSVSPVARPVVRTVHATARPLAQQAEQVRQVDNAAGMLLRVVVTGPVGALPGGLPPLTLPDPHTRTPSGPPAEPHRAPGSADDSVRTLVEPHLVRPYTPAVTAGPGGFAPLSGTAVRGAPRPSAPQYRPMSEQAPHDPSHGLGRPASAEAHAPTGGDQHAVPFAGGSFFGLIRGAGLPATAAPVRDRSGDILEFPG
ncbi:hypothetical protein [Streptomyces sp. Ncost-T10-10d]|uniref:hypothetical protein n=1 Tax=Streptomyces sp. Ncost-T10-10d TaxID=1839774 RepID=UPI00081D6803|nr:hypothetical protein [Streptomyces sp. Ncost-T10-10d]SCF64590.1 hypothetical protein GA0115254_10907 [Streptomyces sp. Ncost-T10-10d]